MDKKKYLLTLLEALQKTRPMAEGLKTLIEANALNDKTLDSLLEIFKRAVNATTDTIKKEKLEKSVAIVEKIKIAEESSKTKDTESLEDLDKLLQEL